MITRAQRPGPSRALHPHRPTNDPEMTMAKYHCDDCDYTFNAPTDYPTCRCGCGHIAYREDHLQPPAPADTDLRDRIAEGSGRAVEAELYVLLRKAGQEPHAAQALIDQHRDEALRRMADEAQPAPTDRDVMEAHAEVGEYATCPYGEGPGDGSGCIKPAGHDGDHVVTHGIPVMPCSEALPHHQHIPHSWRPQPGMPYVHCPGVADPYAGGVCPYTETDAPGSGCILPAGHKPENPHIVTPGDTDEEQAGEGR